MYIFYTFPTSINFTWLTVASLFNICMVVEACGKSTNTLIAMIFIIIATIIGVNVQIRKLDPVPALVLIWGFIAIIANPNAPVDISRTLYICTGILVVFCLITFSRVAANALAKRKEMKAREEAGRELTQPFIIQPEQVQPIHYFDPDIQRQIFEQFKEPQPNAPLYPGYYAY